MPKLFGAPIYWTPNHRRCARSRCRDWGGSTLRRWTCLIEREGGLGSATTVGQIKLLLRGFLMTVRVQCLSGAVRSMLKVAVCLVVAAVTVMALSGLAGTTADALPDHPETSCQPDTPGNDPCAGATGPIGENSCNGDDACVDSSGQIGDGSCIGDDACFTRTPR